MTQDPDQTGPIRIGEPNEWPATVVGAHRLREDLTVVRLIGEFVPFAPGQSVEVRTPQHPNMVRRLYPALPPSLDGKLEFHIRTVPGGWCSGSMVADTRTGDEWKVRNPAGWLAVDEAATEVVMIADGIGLAPLRALLLDLSRREQPPRTHLFVGGRYPRDLYASDMLALLGNEMPWLTIIPVVLDEDDPDWIDDWYESCRVDIGFQPEELITGTLAEVVSRFTPLDHQHILVCGGAATVHATVEMLVATGTPPELIRYEGF
ncbi:FAD-binding oxidoreductase [Nocardia sp. NBC_01503]|uniref:FAD-binding oxidoreductase n=1 Tax=Nocardia sp. NBC_01503 TaxID=2975997 RepID=UPI002E7C2B2D|nr:FAD-binding oxidoreductase [Nocardia sp. NBC_01503]WTL35004.1 FAD-binding oxidoreductase [Nocardia sp. NBC_01503]